MNETNIIGHEKRMQQLFQLWTEDRLPHALLFTGLEGIGKQLVASTLSQRILALETKSQLSLEQHPDFYSIEAEQGPRKNASIKIDVIRECTRYLHQAPLKSPDRVILINDAHLMNLNAANALLKSLEEPPPHNYFILITHAHGQLPKTILSRCQRFHFSPLTQAQIQKILAEQKIQLDSAVAALQLGSIKQNLEIAEIINSVPELSSLIQGPGPDFQSISALSEQIVNQNKTEVFLHALLLKLHRAITGAQPEKLNRNTFEFLLFGQRIVELQEQLRYNVQAKMHLTRLLLFFHEPWKSRL